MSSTTTEQQELADERRSIERSGRLHGAHWSVLALSLVLTFFVWQYAERQAQDKRESRFQRYSSQVAGLIQERLHKYEDALWAGVAAKHSHSQAVDLATWRRFSSALHISDKYPGINGIGVIDYVPRQQLDDYLATHRRDRPAYKVHPQHTLPFLLPITFIMPEDKNAAAIGLDVAHEANRLRAALNARDSGKAQITGPIVLVQDANKTPGFLFYAPFYRQHSETLEERRANFAGMVYAPFVVAELMRGTLEQQQRDIFLRISDGDTVLYDEFPDNHEKQGLFAEYKLNIYGREWQIATASSPSFWRNTDDSQPKIILVCALVIDAMLLLLFISLSRAHRRSFNFAQRMLASSEKNAAALTQTIDKLEQSNHQLERFAFIASHDLREPLRSLGNYSELLKNDDGSMTDEQRGKAIGFIQAAATRMEELLTALLNYSRIDFSYQVETVDCTELLAELRDDLGRQLADGQAEVRVGAMPTIQVGRNEIRQLLQNLITNAIKFRANDRAAQVEIECTEKESTWLFSVCDNGIGIDSAHQNAIFDVFKRLHRHEDIPGSGIGLASCKKLSKLMGGEIWVESEVGKGSCFYFTVPKGEK
ncbi:MAG: sensor histidine kinase [Spongiibacter marinus]|uniref:sensor histidine kinase n=1 Tax=Spongiibacter marinus TaxID=354246 RepID=UPI003C690D01